MSRVKSKGIGGHQRPNRGASDDWLTPQELIEALGSFDLDPCCPKKMPWRTAETMLHCGTTDGLSYSWEGRVWLNPPYGPETGLWLERLAAHGNGVALIFARTETEMFHRWGFGFASAMLFLRGRIHFHRADGTRAKFNSGAPSVLVAYGNSNVKALAKSGIEGRLVRL